MTRPRRRRHPTLWWLALALLAIPPLWRSATDPVGGDETSRGARATTAHGASTVAEAALEPLSPQARPGERSARPRPGHDEPRTELPRLIAEVLGDEGTRRDPRDAPVTNRDLHESGVRAFDPRDLAALQDIIDTNGLDEGSSLFDYDDGDTLLEPWELGFQVWIGGRLVALSFGPDPYASFDYGVGLLPESLGDLSGLRYLDLADNRLVQLPDGVGDLRDLRTLRLNRNDLVALPESVGDLRQLRVLNLSRNQLDTLPRAFADLDSLEHLFLDDNRFASVPVEVTWLQSLRGLGLTHQAFALADQSPAAGDPLLDELPYEVVELPELDHVHVTGNRMHCGGGLFFASTSSGVRVFGLSAQRCSGGNLR